MLKLVGACLVFAGGGALGVLSAMGLTGRIKALGAMVGALEVMERELAFRLTATPELLALAAEGAEPPAEAFFKGCLGELEYLGGKTLAEIWREALPLAGDLGDEALAALDRLGAVLGRFDGESQRAGLAAARAELARCLAEAREESRRLGRVYTTLGVSGGALLALLLL